jgi:hypothetical protein
MSQAKPAAAGERHQEGIPRHCCRIAVEGFQQLHGVRACMVAPTKIIAGLGMSLGMDCLAVPGTTGDIPLATITCISCCY